MDSRTVDSLSAGREFLNELQEGVWVADHDGRVVFANRALAAMLGYESAAPLCGRQWQELLSGAEGPRVAKMDCRVTETALLSRDKGQVPVSLSLVKKTKSGASWLVASAVRLAAAGRPEPADATGRQVMDNSIDGICILENARIVYVNRRFAELTGYTSTQVSHLSLDRMIAQSDRKTFSDMLSDPGRVLAPIHHEVRVVNRSGEEVECELRVVPIESGGKPLLLCFLRDLTELKQADRMRTAFTAMISHDLRTPLAAIKEAVSLLSETASQKLEDRQRRYLIIAREEIDRLNRMIENLVDVSRMEAGKVALHLEGVDLAQLLFTAVESLSLLVSKRNLTIERAIPPRMPQVLADRDRLLRVLGNLLDNAIKYSPVGGTIGVKVDFVDPQAPILSENGILSDTGYVQVTISDDGPGIPAEFLNRIFGKFERVDPYGPGIGLGLSIVRSIIEMHHGRVWASSKLGEGASFSFILPIKDNG